MKEFESSVNSDGTQTILCRCLHNQVFESSVNSDGTQTTIIAFRAGGRV